MEQALTNEGYVDERNAKMAAYKAVEGTENRAGIYKSKAKDAYTLSIQSSGTYFIDTVSKECVAVIDGWSICDAEDGWREEDPQGNTKEGHVWNPNTEEWDTREEAVEYSILSML